jgi:hypothetical protein
MVTHSSTSRPVQCLCMAERTGCPVLTDLWSYVLKYGPNYHIMLKEITGLRPSTCTFSFAPPQPRVSSLLLSTRPTMRVPIQSHSPLAAILLLFHHLLYTRVS